MSGELDKMTAEELEAKAEAFLARAREIKEKEKEEQQRQAELSTLRARRKVLLEQLQAIDSRISEIDSVPLIAQLPGHGGTISDEIVAFVSAYDVVRTADLKVHLDALGLNTANLGQMVAYLKRQGRLEGVGRGKYRVPH